MITHDDNCKEALNLVYLGLGSNMGDSLEILKKVVDLLKSLPHTRVTAVSSLYKTAAIGGPEQPDYLNQVVELESGLTVRQLLAETQKLEQDLGRIRTVRWGPRIIDVDILWYDGVTLADADLEVPHPRLEERRFVLAPLAELAPGLVLSSGLTAREALALVEGQAVELFQEADNQHKA